MSRPIKIILSLICVFVLLVAVSIGFLAIRFVVKSQRDPQQATRQLRDQLRAEVVREESQNRHVYVSGGRSNYAPISNLYELNRRGGDDDDLSSLILQNSLIKKEPRLKYEQLDIDKCNAMIVAYVRRGVSQNGNYYLRSKLVESFGQTNHAVLVNRVRLCAVLLGGEKGSGGMDSRFRPIREEAHRFSPYVVVQVAEYIEMLEGKMARSNTRDTVPRDFKNFVDSLGTSYDSERSIANIGKRNRGELAKEIYAMKVLHRDLSIYYGERVETSSTQRFETIFSEPGTFSSDTVRDLQRRHSSMGQIELVTGFVKLGIELREHLSQLRDNRRSNNGRGSDEEVDQIKRVNEIATVATGLFAGRRAELPPAAQAEILVDLLFLEGLYSKKNRKALLKELESFGEFEAEPAEKVRALNTFLNYMNGLAYAKMDESLGGAARAFSKFTKEADRYLEIEARKSALQVLGLLQLDYYEANRATLQGKKDIHLGGSARGKLVVFRSQNEITKFLRSDPLNGANTIWVLKRGLNMPNEASFAGMILEDPIMKASHYDGYARSRTPPIPLLQIPGAAESYSKFNGKNVLLEASNSPAESVEISEMISLAAAEVSPSNARIRLDVPDGSPGLFAISGELSDEQIREMQKHVGSKAANYAFLRSALPLNPAENEEHIYPGFAVPFHFYHSHIRRAGVDRMIAQIAGTTNPERVRTVLETIRARILSAPVDRNLVSQFQQQMESRLQSHPTNKDGIVKLRLRSSSNAEDNKEFSGAGLYESHFAFYHFGQGRPPNRDSFIRNDRMSRTAEDTTSQRIAEAIAMVWASLWKAEAYFARERAGIVQDTVRMGILVHPSYRKEESTGVVFYYAPDDIEIVVNKGNVNVQNPSIAGLTPEMHIITDGPDKISHSSRYSISRKSILSKKDRNQLMALIEGVLPKFRALYPKQGISGVDIEFKVLEVPDSEGETKDVVMLKQIRPLANRPSPRE